MEYLSNEFIEKWMNSDPEVGKILVESLPKSAWEEWCEKDGVVCFGFEGSKALKIFFGNPKNLSVYHVADFRYAKDAKDADPYAISNLAFTLVGSQIYVLGCGHLDKTAPVYRCDLKKQLPTGSYLWEAGPQLKTHKHHPLVFNLAGDIYVLSSLIGYDCDCERFEVMKKGGADEWESLRVPEGLSGGRDEKSFGGACVFEQGKKILVLVVQRSNGALTLFTYDAGSNEWEDPKDVRSPDYTFPLDLNNPFVISGNWFAKEGILQPLGLKNLLPLPEASRGERFPRFPTNWHLFPLTAERFCLLLVHGFQIEDPLIGMVSKSHVQFATFDLVEPQNHTSPYKIDVKDIKFFDIAIGGEFLLPYTLAPCTIVPGEKWLADQENTLDRSSSKWSWSWMEKWVNILLLKD